MMWNHWKIFDKMTWIMIYWGAQADPEIGSLGPIFNTPLKVAQIDMYTKTGAQPVGNFWENDFLGGPKWPTNWASEAHILHTSKSTWNEYVKQYCCETSEFFLRKWPNTRNFLGPKMTQKSGPYEAHILHISGSSSNAYIKQDWCESRPNFSTKYSTTWFWLIWRPKMVQNLGLWCISFRHLQK